VIAQAPIFSSVSSGGTYFSFCAMVPLRWIALAVRPTLTPRAVIIPGEYLESSMVGIARIAAASAASWEKPSRFLFSGGGSPVWARFFSWSSSWKNFCLAISPAPKVDIIFRRTS
jgi:hypothetical protein